jgi:hypothetical protein
VPPSLPDAQDTGEDPRRPCAASPIRQQPAGSARAMQMSTIEELFVANEYVEGGPLWWVSRYDDMCRTVVTL